jgi:hypothetical protein
MRGLKMLLLGMALAFPAGFAAGVATAYVLTSEQTANFRREVARKLFGVEPGVDFESLHQ